MTPESRWYAAVIENDGRPPEVLRFTADELADPRLALQLALAILEGEAGYRTTGNDDGTVTWYWPRPAGDWWAVPRSLNLAAHQAIDAAVLEACRRNNGIGRRGDVIELLRERLGQFAAVKGGAA
jgi:hypothetical protein